MAFDKKQLPDFAPDPHKKQPPKCAKCAWVYIYIHIYINREREIEIDR
jgi:hypothetical protein